MNDNFLIIKSDFEGICEFAKDIVIGSRIRKDQLICTYIQYQSRYVTYSPVNGVIKNIFINDNDYVKEDENILAIQVENVFENNSQKNDLSKYCKIRRNKEKRRNIILGGIGYGLLCLILALVFMGMENENLAGFFGLIMWILLIRCGWNIFISIFDFLFNGSIREIKFKIGMLEFDKLQKEGEERIKTNMLAILKKYVFERYKREVLNIYNNLDDTLITRDFLYEIMKKGNSQEYLILRGYKDEFIEDLNRKMLEQKKLFLDELLDVGSIELKESLLNANYGDIKTIDNYVKSLEKLVKTPQPILGEKRQDDRKEIAEEELEPLNYFYELQNDALTNVLNYGINNVKFIEPFINPNTDIEHQIKSVLQNSIYPSFNNKIFELEYNPENKVLIVDYFLPLIEDINPIKNIEYKVTKNIFKECYYTDKEQQTIYDNLLYEITLRSICEIFSCIDEVETIAFNGILDYVDNASGKNKIACILSVQASREEFEDINLSKVIPVECFKKLKGISSKALHAITPIRPILQLNKDDKRFVEAYGVMDSIEEGDNLATMDWHDFENLIREIFEKSFSQNGGEVKVTQSSRDGGVDAIAFDPDPIRGGKIVIQAKRYTNVVGVSAVRDLYGTVINEGAIKGILVTTADFGNDSHEFAKDKPLTLLNGNHLLHLLEQYGYKARINLKEAKEYFKTVDPKTNYSKHQ